MRKYSRILALALAAALLLSIPTLAWKAEPQDLTDVEVTFDESVDPAKNGNQPSAWAKPEVEAALAAGRLRKRAETWPNLPTGPRSLTGRPTALGS